MKLTLLPLENDGVLRVRCDGPLSFRELPPRSDPLRDLLGPQCFAQKVLLNLLGSGGMDTSGMTWLLRQHYQFQQAGGKLVLYNVPPSVTQMLDVLRLSSTLEMAAGDEEAREIALGSSHQDLKNPALPSAPDVLNPAVRPVDLTRPPRAV